MESLLPAVPYVEVQDGHLVIGGAEHLVRRSRREGHLEADSSPSFAEVVSGKAKFEPRSSVDGTVIEEPATSAGIVAKHQVRHELPRGLDGLPEVLRARLLPADLVEARRLGRREHHGYPNGAVWPRVLPAL